MNVEVNELFQAGFLRKLGNLDVNSIVVSRDFNVAMGIDAPDSSVQEIRNLHRQLEELRAQLTAVESERDEYAQKNAELFVLQQVFSTINSTLEINDILSMVLRGVIEALKFKRVILFDVTDAGVIVRRLEADADGRVVHALDPRQYRSDSTLQGVAQGNLQLAYGSSADEDKPLEDVRQSYCLAPLLARDIVRGMLYADDPPGGTVTENQVGVVLDFASQAAFAVENARLYAETRRLLEETQRLAHTDTLTGIPNRRALHELLERELHTSDRYDTPFAYAILDLDDLKKINDSGGHSLGDLALKRLAQVLKKNARKGDIIARYAGDEFVIVMAQSDADQARRGIERIIGALRRNGLATSIGVAMFPNDGTDAQTLFFAADEALYQAKQAGKNDYRFYARG
jgi:diguanylate cyclase (GGDEF)-like protein